MHLEGERRIAAPPEQVWAALDDTEVLRRCLPGCDSLERTGETEMAAVATVRVGPVQARFRGTLSLEDVRPPTGLRIRGRGQGGTAGFAEGEARVALTGESAGTVVRYAVDARVGGKLAQIGGRLVDQAAAGMAEAFFAAFESAVADSGDGSDAGTVPPARPSDAAGRSEPAQMAARLAWLAAIAGATALAVWMLS